jgi:hypothetical protein
MRKMNQGPMGQLKRRCKLKNHGYSREEVKKDKKPQMIQDKIIITNEKHSSNKDRIVIDATIISGTIK